MALNTEKFIIGIDLGGTGIKIGLLDTSYEILIQDSVPTGAERPYQEVIKDMGNTALKLMQEKGFHMENCLGAGIGSPGTVDSKNGVVLYSNNIRWDHVPLAEELSKYLPVPIYANNDANCAALGEVKKGAAKGYQNAVFFTLGTGVGGGIVIDGKIFEGGHPGGAEIGHMVLHRNGRKCTCGRAGCLEAYASATALIKEAKRVALEKKDSKLLELCQGEVEKMNAKIPFDAAEAGDSFAKELIEDYIGFLGEGIVDMVNVFRPDIVVLGGGVCAQKEKLTSPLQAQVEKECFGGDMGYIPKIVTALNGNDAGIIGAGALVEF